MTKMKAKDFETIKSTLENRIAKCNEKLGNIKTTADLKRITVGEAQSLKSWAQSEQGIMDQIIQKDLYHIIGMGNLTVPQYNLSKNMALESIKSLIKIKM